MDKLTKDELLNIMQQMKTAYDNEFDRKKLTEFCRCKSCNITIKNLVYYGNGEETYFHNEIHKCNICNNRFCEECVIGADAPNQYYCKSCEKIKNITLK